MSEERTHEANDSDESIDFVLHDWSLSPLEAAEIYFSNHKILPLPLRYWPRGYREKASEKFEKATSDASKFFGSVDDPHFYTIHLEDFPLSQDPETQETLEWIDPGNPRYLWQNVTFWKGLIGASFDDEVLWKLEANSRRVCVHIVAGRDAGLQHLPRGGELVKKVSEPVGLLAYLLKEPLAIKEEIKSKITGLTYDKDEAIKRFAIWIENKRYFNERARLQKLHGDLYGRNYQITPKEQKALTRKYAKLPEEYNLASQMTSVWLDQKLRMGQDRLPEWVNENFDCNRSREVKLPRLLGYMSVRSKAGSKRKINHSDIRIIQQSHLHLRPLVQLEQAIEAQAKLRDLSDLQCPVTSQTMQFYNDLYKASRTSTTNPTPATVGAAL